MVERNTSFESRLYTTRQIDELEVRTKLELVRRAVIDLVLCLVSGVWRTEKG